jgi:iron complex outermembrane receptor protein
MKNPNTFMCRLAALLFSVTAAPLIAQTDQPATAVPVETRTAINQDETVKMNPFEVSAARVGPYQVAEGTSGGRIAVTLFDSGQSIYVVTNALIEDLGANSMLDAVKYMPGVSVNTYGSFENERATIRGFQTTGIALDGIFDHTPQGGSNFDISALADRVEVVLGADSVLSPSGIPGGTINAITKRPLFSDFSSVRLDVGRYGANKVVVDVNREVSQKAAFRLVVTGAQYHANPQMFNIDYNVMPELSWKFGNGSVLTLQYRFMWSSHEQFNGIPLDPASTGTLTRDVILLPGTSIYTTVDYQSQSRSGYNDCYHENRQSWSALYSSRLTDALSTRVAARFVTTYEHSFGSDFLVGTPGGAYDPLTGIWTPGFTYGPAPTYTPTPAVQNPDIYNSSIQGSYYQDHEYSVQNDYAYEYQNNKIKSISSAGLAANIYHSPGNIAVLYSRPAFNVVTGPVPQFTNTGSLTNDQYITGYSDQVYINENLKLFSDRVILNGGLVKNWFYQQTSDYIRNVEYSTRPTPTFRNYGILIKPTANIAVYYSHAESAQQVNTLPNPTLPVISIDLAKQDEAGIRMKFLKGRGVASVAKYQILQSNFGVLNPAIQVFPLPVPTPPGTIYENRVARGWEYQVNFALTNNLSFVSSYTNLCNVNPLGVPFRNVAPNSGAALIHYDWRKGSLKGLGMGIGYYHSGRAPGDTVTGVTIASTSTHEIPNQPTFYLPAYGLWNVTAVYKRGSHWEYRAYIDNLLNVKYFQGSVNRYNVFPGLPINVRMSISYSL